MTALIRHVPSGWSCSVKAERKWEEGWGREGAALGCYPPYRAGQSNIHPACRRLALVTLSKTDLLPCFFGFLRYPLKAPSVVDFTEPANILPAS